MWVKWTMILVKLEGPLETRTRGFSMKAARGSRGRLRPAHTSPPKYLKIEKNRQLANAALGPGGGNEEFFCTFSEIEFFLKDCLNVSKAESR